MRGLSEETILKFEIKSDVTAYKSCKRYAVHTLLCWSVIMANGDEVIRIISVRRYRNEEVALYES